MKVQIWLKEASNPIEYDKVINAYQKGDFYCIYMDEISIKYPIINIWRIAEDYPDTLRLSNES